MLWIEYRPGGWTGTVVSLGGISNTGGTSANTLALTGLTIPAGAVVFVFSSMGTNTAGLATAACTNVTFATGIDFSNNGPNPDRRTTWLTGVAGASAGSTLTVTFPASSTERMMCACYLTGAPTTNNGADAVASLDHDNDNNYSVPMTPAAGHAVMGFAWISSNPSGTPIVGTGATQVLDYSPGTTPVGGYAVAIVKWENGQTNPEMTAGALGGGQGLFVELTGLLT